jgi:2'-5' RNA ligase
MAEPNKSAAIVLLPTTDDWCKQEFPHVTLVYLGDEVNLDSFQILNNLLKTAYYISVITNPFWLKVSGVELFGEDKDVDVLRLELTPLLLAIRGFFEEWDNGDYSDYKPHATIGPAYSRGENLPMALLFDRICVWWGDEKNIYWFAQ